MAQCMLVTHQAQDLLTHGFFRYRSERKEGCEMKKAVIIVGIGVLLALGLSSGGLWAYGGGHGGGGTYQGGGGHYGGRGHYGGGGHYRGRGFYGFGGFYGGYYGFPYYYPGWDYPYYYPYAYPYDYPDAYPSPAYPSASVPVPSQPQQSYWYYCKDSKAYYPYVTSCPSGWVPVVPTPPPSGREGGPR